MNTVLVDRTNIAVLKPVIIALMQKTTLIGLDIETHDADRHDGLNKFMRCDEDGRKAKNKKLVFDARRTTVCGLSLYPDGQDYAFYFNINHADQENRLHWAEVQEVLDSRPPNAYWVIHNAPFERVMLRAAVGYDVERYICTLQLAVSVYGPDNYDLNRFFAADFAAVRPLLMEAQKLFATYSYGDEMTTPQAELFAKIVGKESDASYSYNGLIDGIA